MGKHKKLDADIRGQNTYLYNWNFYVNGKFLLLYLCSVSGRANLVDEITLATSQIDKVLKKVGY